MRTYQDLVHYRLSALTPTAAELLQIPECLVPVLDFAAQMSPARQAQKFFYENQKENPYNNLAPLLSRLGEISGVHHFRLTDSDWKAGAFGDRGSCFFGSKTFHRSALRNHSCLALQFFSWNAGTKTYDGHARCWVYNTEKHYILFNGYGKALKAQAVIFADWVKKPLSYQRFELHIDGTEIYVNDMRGVYVGDPDLIRDTHYIGTR